VILLSAIALAADLPCGGCPVTSVLPVGVDASGHALEVVRVVDGDWRGDWLVTSRDGQTLRVHRIAAEPTGEISVVDGTVRWLEVVSDGSTERRRERVVGLSPVRLLEQAHTNWYGHRADGLRIQWQAEGLTGRMAVPMCGGRVHHDSRTVPRVALGGAWAPLGSCATTLDAAADTVWGEASTAADAALRVVMVSDRELWVEVSDDAFVHGAAESWVGDDHLELWLPVPSVDGCTEGSATQWGIALDGTVHHGKGPPQPPPRVEVDGRRFRLRLPAPTWWLAVHYSDSDGEGQERLVGTGRVQGTLGASLARVQPAETQVECTPTGGSWAARPRPGGDPAPVPRLDSPAVPACEGCERIDAGTGPEGQELTVWQQECGRSVLEVRRDEVLQHRMDLPASPCAYNHWQITTEVGDNRWASHSSDGSFASSQVSRSLQLVPLRELEHTAHTHDMHSGWIEDLTFASDVLGPAFQRSFAGCGGRDEEVAGRGLARVQADAPWGTPLGACATSFDGSAPAWGSATSAADARVRAVLAGPAELWVEVDDDVRDTDGASWVDRDHLELWLAPPVGGDRCDPAMQWAIELDGTVHAAHGAPPLMPRVVDREERDGGMALRVELPWPAGALSLVFSDADGDGQEALVGTNHVEGARWQVAPVDGRAAVACRPGDRGLEPVGLGAGIELGRPRPQ